MLADHFGSPGCPEHCVPACRRDGNAQGFIGKKSASQQSCECKQSVPQIFCLFSSFVAASLSLVPSASIASVQIEFQIRSGVCGKEKVGEMSIMLLLFDALYQSCTRRSARGQFKGAHALYVCETLEANFTWLV